MTNIEFCILYALAIHHGSVLSKEQIYNFVWNGEYLQDDSNITSNVLRLRTKIEDNPNRPEYIQTVRGIGYRIKWQTSRIGARKFSGIRIITQKFGFL